jgi:LPXTG-motif cell wall-anchored protein
MALLLFAGPARADTRVGLSTDGKTWSQALTKPLFDPAMRWVPGDSRISSFHVRNQAGTGAELRVAIHSDDQHDLLANDDIRLEARAAGGDWAVLANTATAKMLNTDALGVGESTRVDLRATFDAASTNQSQTSAVALRFQVTLSQAGPKAPSGSPGGGTGILPATGAPFGPWVVWLGAALTGAGLALVRRSRREAAT